MSISPAIITKPETRARYRLFHVICLDNIQRKFAQRQHMETDKIYCRNDPSPTYFRVSMDFGREAEALKVFLKPVDREVKVTLGRIELFDGCNRLKSWEDDRPVIYTLNGRYMEYTPEATSEATSEATTWRLEIDLVYEGVTSVTSVTPVAPVRPSPPSPPSTNLNCAPKKNLANFLTLAKMRTTPSTFEERGSKLTNLF